MGTTCLIWLLLSVVHSMASPNLPHLLPLRLRLGHQFGSLTQLTRPSYGHVHSRLCLAPYRRKGRHGHRHEHTSVSSIFDYLVTQQHRRRRCTDTRQALLWRHAPHASAQWKEKEFHRLSTAALQQTLGASLVSRFDSQMRLALHTPHSPFSTA